jgi:hypothetical protein
MNHDPERLLEQLTPCRVSAEIRCNILDAVADELHALKQWRNQQWLGLATVVLLLLSIVFNLWVKQSICQRIASLYPPVQPSREVVETANYIATYTNPQVGEWMYQQMISNQSEQLSSEQSLSIISKIIDESQ